MRYIKMFEEGSAEERDLLGGKGANLAEMTRMGLPVPPGFTITTEACRSYLTEDRLPDGLETEILAAVEDLEDRLGRRFGDPADPLLLSVRSGARFSMPGMMDTVLNLGLNSETVKGLAQATDDERFAYDAYRRLLDLYGRVVLGVDDDELRAVRDRITDDAGVADPSELDVAGLHALADAYEHVIEEVTGSPFPADPHAQLLGATEAVFSSWNGRRARDYRRMEGIPDDLGTAVNVQTMVFGNRGPESGTGVVFTRDPATGEPEPYGDFLLGAQGEDVVAGIRHTEPIAALADEMPDIYTELVDVLDRLEDRFRDMCDVEFTIEESTLYVLQTRVGKRSADAAIRMAVDMREAGIIGRDEALERVTPEQVERLLHPRFDPNASFEVLATGLNASPGAATGHATFTADEAESRAASGEAVILVRQETSPDDLHGILAAEGVLTSHGGLVSHAAVVARGIGKPAVCGASALDVDVAGRRFRVDGVEVGDGDLISIDGTTGQVVLGEVAVVTPSPSEHLNTLLSWADEVRRLGVAANADTGEDARRARAFGAEGIGLTRTEHMFLGDRLPIVQRLILADGAEELEAALTELHDVQLDDYMEVLEAMDGLPVTVRLLDPPLHEFLPDLVELLIADAEGGLDERGHVLLEAARHWEEENPMLGTRGIRLAVLRPEIYRMQARALMEAAVQRRADGGDPRVNIMLPLVVSEAELLHVLGEVREVADEVVTSAGVELDYQLGTMVETPRAALLAGDLAPHIDFISFGTNDLTQMVFGFSRDDVESRIMSTYLELGLLEANPFGTLDRPGVGHLVRFAVEQARAANPGIEIGICGEHGGDPASIAFCDEAGLDYVSCSPFRVSVARLAAARSTLGIGAADDR
jgi:pyruvate, orthophosphate dikinase